MPRPAPGLQEKFCKNVLFCRKNIINLRQNTSNNMMQSIDDKVTNVISKCGRGYIFFPSDFSRIGERKSILKALERMTEKGVVIRVARGIYCYPKVEKKLGLGVIKPSFEEVAKAIAKRDKARIIPTGAYALNRLGLSTQVPMNVEYLTDGSSRKIVLSGNRGVHFKHVSPKNLAFKSELACMICSALKEVGKESLSEDYITKISELLKQEDKSIILQDINLMPDWIAKIVRSAYE